MRLLIADDEALVCEELQLLVHDFGHSCCGLARNGKEAIELCQKENPDLILMDIRMPGMDGLEASHIIQQRCPTPIVIMTSYTSKEFVDRACNSGVGAYLLKPPNWEDLERAIFIAQARHREWLEQKQLVEDLRRAQAEIRTLQGLLPTCPSCKKIRGESGYWQNMENYLQERTQAHFTHTLCPNCYQQAKERIP